MSKQTIPVIIDCDPGHDDAIAIMAAIAHPETFRILGLTTVVGNQTVEKVTDNLLKVLDYLGVPLEVAMGCAHPLVSEPEPQPQAHGESGMDGPKLPPARSRAIPTSAVERMHELLAASPDRVTLVALAPLTNLAKLLTQYPDSREKIEKICLMGGSLYSGNILPRAEFNIYHDADAAKIVFACSVPIVMSGLEVCAAAAVKDVEYQALRGGGRASELTCDLLDFFFQYNKARGIDSSPIFDLTVVLQLLCPEIFTSKRYHIDIEATGEYCRGMTVADFRPPAGESDLNVEVLLDVDRERYLELFLSSIRELDRRVAAKE